MIIDRKRQKRAVMIRLENVCFAYEKEIALRYVAVSYTHLLTSFLLEVRQLL